MKLFSTSNFVIPKRLAITTIPVNKIIIFLFFFAIDPRKDVNIDFSVSLTFISFSEENIFNSEGNKKMLLHMRLLNQVSSSTQSQ